jgi:hypothetical protein
MKCHMVACMLLELSHHLEVVTYLPPETTLIIKICSSVYKNTCVKDIKIFKCIVKLLKFLV